MEITFSSYDQPIAINATEITGSTLIRVFGEYPYNWMIFRMFISGSSYIITRLD